LDRRRATRWRRAIAIRFEPARQGLSATSSEPVLGNNRKQLAADELCGPHCRRRSEQNDSGIIRARRADARWRNEEIFADILRRRGGWSPIDSARLVAWNLDGPAAYSWAMIGGKIILKKYRVKSVTCAEGLITSACYLCNTILKTVFRPAS
jgi:hypothetical protein